MVNIIDAIMGAGKSTYAIQMINDKFWEQYLIVVPFLAEIERYKSSIRFCDVVEPKNWGRSKSMHLKELITKGKNIVTTHQLITRLDEDTLRLLKARNYTLILDESLEVIKKYPIKQSDLAVLLNGKYIFCDERGYIKWDYKNKDALKYDGDFYAEMKHLCDLNALMPYRNTGNGEISSIIWNFPAEFFRIFKDVFIFTYLWNGSFQKAYFDLHGIEYGHYSLYKGKPTEYSEELEHDTKQRYRELILVVDDAKLNSIGDPLYTEQPFSNSWFKRLDEATLKTVKDNTYNFFRNKTSDGSKFNMWSTYKGFQSIIKGKGYAGTRNNPCFVPFNIRGTNDFAHKVNLAYLVNIFPEPELTRFFDQNGIALDLDTYALSCMVQWIWRSQIRKGKPINLYLPSNRMRRILSDWLAK